MSDEQQDMEVVQSTALEIPARNLSVSRAPDEVLREAQKAASVLKDVISKKKNPVKFNGRQYLEFEDWQTVGRFYGLTARVRESKYVQYGEAKGFEAIADAVLVATGDVVSTAEAMCLDDERNWKTRTLNQIRSMAQTRACAKALRNVLSWVVVLAGYAPTPMEEMDGIDTGGHPVGTQAAADHVRDQKIKDGGLPNGETPKELQGMLSSVAKDTRAFGQICEKLSTLMVEKAGAVGTKAYEKVVDLFTERYPSGTSSVQALQQCIREVYAAYLALTPKLDPTLGMGSPKEPAADSLFDEHMKEEPKK